MPYLDLKHDYDAPTSIGSRRAALATGDYLEWCFGDCCRRRDRRKWSGLRKIGKLNRKRLRREARGVTHGVD